jgi:adenosylcobinamide hydrolase
MSGPDAAARSPIGASPAAWTITADPSALVVRLARPGRAASSAVLGGGLLEVDAVVNHAVRASDERALAEPEAWLREICGRLALDPERTAALMTGVEPERTVVVEDERDGIELVVFVTAGLANALRVGDPATVRSTAPGTINLIAVVGVPMTDAALVEAVAIAVEARTLAALEARVPSLVSGEIATGTGTDAVVVAALGGAGAIPHCGKHTSLGELVGRAVLAASRRAIRVAVGARR